MAAVGGRPQPVTTLDAEEGEIGHVWPEILPDGESVLFTILKSPVAESQIAVLSLDSGEHKVVLQGGSYPRYSPTGHLLYGMGERLWAVGFDLNHLETVGDPVPVQEGVRTKNAGAADFSVSENGSLLYVAGGGGYDPRTVVWVDREGREEPLRLPPGLSYHSPRTSPDGTRVAFHRVDLEDSDIWVSDLASSSTRKLVADPLINYHPRWTPDSSRLAYTRGQTGRQLYWIAADGTGEAQLLLSSPKPRPGQSRCYR